MAVPTWSVGEVLTASDVNTWFVPQAAFKTVAQHVGNSTVMVNDADLLLPLTANAVYRMTCYLNYDGPALGTGDIQCTWAVPSGTNYWLQAVAWNAAGNPVDRLTFTAGQVQIYGTEGAGVNRACTMQGSLAVGSASGTLQFRWAQATANSTVDTIVGTGSLLLLQRVG